jgi:hypothetical protein
VFLDAAEDGVYDVLPATGVRSANTMFTLHGSSVTL